MSRAPTIRRRRGPVRVPALLAAGLLAALAAPVAAQHPGGGGVYILKDTLGDVVTTRPATALPGKTFKFEPARLPANTTVQLMMGAVGEGFEVVKTVTTDKDGLVKGSTAFDLTVPAWIKRDRSYLVMAEDMDFKPLAPAVVFNATDPQGGLKRRGKVVVGSRCVILFDELGARYPLSGDLEGLKTGDEIIVDGAIDRAFSENCGSGIPIRIEKRETVGSK